MARIWQSPSERRSALRLVNREVHWKERHEARRRVANKAGCRKYIQDRCSLLGVDVVYCWGGRRWKFLVNGVAFARWYPGPASLKFCDGDGYHVHDVFQLEYEIRRKLRAA